MHIFYSFCSPDTVTSPFPITVTYPGFVTQFAIQKAYAVLINRQMCNPSHHETIPECWCAKFSCSSRFGFYMQNRNYC